MFKERWREDDVAPVPAAASPETFDLVFLLARLAITTLFFVGAALIARPFLTPLTWALVLCVVLARPHRVLEARVGPVLAAGLSTAFAAFAVIVPLLLVSERLIREGVAGARLLQEQLSGGQWRQILNIHPYVKMAGDWIERELDLQTVLGEAATTLTNTGAKLLQQSTGQAIVVLLIFYMLFFFLRDRSAGLALVARYSPFSDMETGRLFQRVRATIRAIVFGTFAVAALQGALGGLMFWWLSLPSPMLWGLIMGLLSLIPVLGSFIVWIPMAIYLAIEQRWTAAIILVLWGAFVIGLVDNFLRPLLVSGGLRLHTAVSFIAILGGVYVFGATGLVLGPIVLSTTMLLLEIWRRRGAGLG